MVGATLLAIDVKMSSSIRTWWAVAADGQSNHRRFDALKIVMLLIYSNLYSSPCSISLLQRVPIESDTLMCASVVKQAREIYACANEFSTYTEFPYGYD